MKKRLSTESVFVCPYDIVNEIRMMPAAEDSLRKVRRSKKGRFIDISKQALTVRPTENRFRYDRMSRDEADPFS